MYFYKLFGLTVKTDVKLYGKELADSISVDVTMIGSPLEEIYRDIHENVYAPIVVGEERPSVVHRHTEQQSTIWVDGVGLFHITNGNLIEYRCFKTIDDLQFQQWLMAMAFSILVIQREKILLHGAVLRLPNENRAIGVCGESGAGKSTISNELLKRGLRFLSDDEILFDVDDEVYALGTYPWRRVCLDVYEKEQIDKSKSFYFEDGSKKKYVIDMSDEYEDQRTVIDQLFVLTLTDEDDMEIVPVTGADKVHILLENLFKKAVYETVGIPPQMFKELVQIATKVDIYIIKRPIGKMTVNEITDQIVKIVGESD